MKLDDKDIQEFKEIYRKEFGEELSDAEAERRARQVLTFYEVIYGILLRRRAAGRKAEGGSSGIDESGPPDTVEDTQPLSGTNPAPLAADAPDATAASPQVRPRPRVSP